jgi:hypothetical protein
MDCWTSPNHWAFMAITTHLEVCGVPLCLLLDIVKVASSHTGTVLAEGFTQILKDFGIAHKVSELLVWMVQAPHDFIASRLDMQQCWDKRHDDRCHGRSHNWVPREGQSDTMLCTYFKSYC